MIAALTLNPIARRRRAGLDNEALAEETNSLSTHDAAVSVGTVADADADSHSAPSTEHKDSESGSAIVEEPRNPSDQGNIAERW